MSKTNPRTRFREPYRHRLVFFCLYVKNKFHIKWHCELREEKIAPPHDSDRVGWEEGEKFIFQGSTMEINNFSDRGISMEISTGNATHPPHPEHVSKHFSRIPSSSSSFNSSPSISKFMRIHIRSRTSSAIAHDTVLSFGVRERVRNYECFGWLRRSSVAHGETIKYFTRPEIWFLFDYEDDAWLMARSLGADKIYENCFTSSFRALREVVKV